MTNTSKLPFDDEFTKVPNIIFDLMPHISSAQFSVLMVIVRKTYGWQKTEDIISLSQITEITGLSQRNVHDALKALVEQCFVVRRSASPEDMAARHIKRKPSQQFWYTVNLVAIGLYLRKGDSVPMQNLHTSADTPMQILHRNGDDPMQNLHTNDSIPMQNLHTQKKEPKEKELKESASSSSSFSFNSLGESESTVGSGVRTEPEPLNAPTPGSDNRAPDVAIAQTLQAWQTIRCGNEKRGEKKTLRDLCAKHGVQVVYRAILAAQDAGKTDGVGWVKWWIENKHGGVPDHMRGDAAQEVKTYIKYKVSGGLYNEPDKFIIKEETRVNGKLIRDRLMPDGFVPPNQAPGLSAALDSVAKPSNDTYAPSGGLRRALAASIANNGPVGTYTGPTRNLP